MNWLNLKTSHLREPAFIGSEPVARATWLCVLSYCIELENGGRIAGARLWKDRQWQQACGVMLSEIQATTNLLTWEGDDLLVWNYPSDKEFEVQQMRELGRAKSAQKAEAARTNGLQGGRPKKEEKPNDNPTKNPTAETQPNPTETHRKEGERKGKEGEREEARAEGAGAHEPPEPPGDDPAHPPGWEPPVEMFVAECARYSVPEWYAVVKWETHSAKGWASGRTPIRWKEACRWVRRDFINDGSPMTEADAAPFTGKTTKKNGMFLSE